ncbi:MAG: hypothetical protein KJ060_16140, partial [Candidatus Hydrogenedentes bacterium]|nr:hypothetical protein [Candidatus Hydrogenedentota bacterium]
MGTPVDNDPVVEALPTSKSPWALPNIILGGATWVLLYVLWYVFWELRGEPPLRIPSAAVNLFLVVGATIFASAVREWLILEGPDVEIKKDSKKHVIYLIVRACLPTGWFTLVCFVCWAAMAGFCYLFLDARIEKPEELLSKYDAAGLELGVSAGTEDEPARTLNPAEFRVGLSELFDDSLTFLANCKYNLRDSAEIPIRRRDLLLYFFASGTIPLEALYNSSVRGLGPYHVRFLLFEPGKVERSEVEASIWPDSGPNPDFQRLLGVSCVDFMGELLKELRQAGNPVEGF